MRVGLLGPVRVDAAGVEPSIAGARLRGLLARLAADAGRPVPVPVLVAALWEDAGGGPADPAGALQSLASRLRRALGRPDVLAGAPGGYRLAVAPGDVDALRFEAEVARGRERLAAGDPAGARDVLATALALWRGPALSDVAELPFAPELAGRWERLRLAALEDRIEADLRLGPAAAPGGAGGLVEELQSLVAAHPLRERLHGQLLRALAAAGRGAEALAHYAAVRELLAEELGTDPGPELRAVHAQLLATPGPDRPAAPAPAAGAGVPGLPLPLTSFVGREEDVARVCRLLAEHRLVTLVGPGGAGKTRLAVEVGRRTAGRAGPGGPVAAGSPGDPDVRLVALAPVVEGHDVPRAALAALDGRESGLLGHLAAPDGPAAQDSAERLVERLLERLGGRPVVLVMDNCEHLVADAAALVDTLLQRCPGLRVLATSREPLHVLGERLHPVDPLPLPAERCTPQEALAVPAVRLLADRAAAVAPHFAVDEATVAPVVEICRRLDGLPLAIELAAARLRTTPVALVAERLDDRFRLLTGGNRTALPRHQTLRAVVAWSWDLLDPADRLLLERLAVLPGGFDAGSAAALDGAGDPDPVPDLDLADRLAGLHDRSLLQPAGTSPGGLPRYRMLETIREFGLERLAGRGEAPAVRARACAHFRALAGAAEPHLRTRGQLPWLDRLNAEHDNLLAAVRWAADAGDAATAVRICAALSWYWNLRGSFGEALTWLEVALAVQGPVAAADRAIALVQHTLCSLTAGRIPGPEVIAEVEAVVAAVPAPGPPLLAMAMPALAIVGGDVTRGLDMLGGVPPTDDPWTQAALLLMEGVFAENGGEVDRALDVLPRSLAVFRELGERWGMATALTSLGELLPMAGDVAGGLAALEEAAALSRELGAFDDAAHLEMRMLALQLHADPAGRPPRARAAELRARLEELVTQDRVTGRATFLRAGVEMSLAELDERAGDLEAARRRAHATLDLLRSEPGVPPQARAMVLAQLAELEVARGDAPAAAGLLRDRAVVDVLGWDMPVAARVTVAAAAVRAATGDAAGAALLLGSAAAVRGREDLSDTRRARLERQLRERLGAGFDEPYARGAAAPRAQAIELLTAAIWPDGAPAPGAPGAGAGPGPRPGV